MAKEGEPKDYTGTLIQMSKRLDSIDSVLRSMQLVMQQVARTEEKVAGLLQKTMDHDQTFKEMRTQIDSLRIALAAHDKEDVKTALWIEILKKGMIFLFILLLGYMGTHPKEALEAIKVLLGVV